MATIWASMVSEPTFSACITSAPVPFTVPPISQPPPPVQPVRINFGPGQTSAQVSGGVSAGAPGAHVPGGAAGTGWTLYPPLSVQMGMGMDMAIFAVHILGMSSIMGSINIITTILNMRAPGMTLMKMPLFVWTWLITAYLLIAVMPVLAGAITMVPVSYTHLRAHETVLDLVCRLLLE